MERVGEGGRGRRGNGVRERDEKTNSGKNERKGSTKKRQREERQGKGACLEHEI